MQKGTSVAIAAILALVLATVSIAPAQEQPEPLFESLGKAVKSKAFNLNLLSQFGGDFQSERRDPGQNGFSVPNLRVGFSGELDGGVGYVIWMNMVQSPAILGADLSVKVKKGIVLTAGAFKVPFSAEDLTPESSVDLANRSLAVVVFSPSWQLGAQAEVALIAGRLWFAGGVFNGNGLAGLSNDGNNVMGVARLRYLSSEKKESCLSGGIAIARSSDSNVDFGNNFLTGFRGTRLLLDADVRWNEGPVLASAEVVGAELKFADGGKKRPFGYQLTAGLMVTPMSQVLLRYDHLQTDGIGANNRLVILGLNVWPSSPTQVQVNYVVNSVHTQPKFHRLVSALQLGF